MDADEKVKPPVCVLTCGRPYFETTMRSLSATDGDFDLCVWDDSKAKAGVVNASCAAIRTYMTHNGLILVQDDVVFAKDWYERIMRLDGGGIVAGMTIRTARTPTAQCLYIGYPFFSQCAEWFTRKHKTRLNFDTQICKLSRVNGFPVTVCAPAVCEHIGEKSAVRPTRSWINSDGSTRTSGMFYGTIAMSDTIRPYMRMGKS